MDKRTKTRKKSGGGSDIIKSVDQSILALAEHLAEYVHLLQLTEGGPALRTKQRV